MSSSPIIFAKLDPGFFSNRKIMRAGRNGRDVFTAVLCLNAGRGGPGWIPSGDLEPWYLARYIGITVEEARDGVAAALAAELIAMDGDCVVIVGWSVDWSRRPKTDAERSRDYRDRKDEQSRTYRSRHEASVTRHEASVTASRENHASRIRGEESRGERGDARDAGPPLSGGGNGNGGGESQAKPLPHDWRPSSASIAYGNGRGLDVAEEARRFRLNATSKGHTFADPDAAFDLFMARSRDAGKHRPPKPGAYTAKPPRSRVQTFDGKYLVDDGTGNLVPEEPQEGKT